MPLLFVTLVNKFKCVFFKQDFPIIPDGQFSSVVQTANLPVIKCSYAFQAFCARHFKSSIPPTQLYFSCSVPVSRQTRTKHCRINMIHELTVPSLQLAALGAVDSAQE